MHGSVSPSLPGKHLELQGFCGGWADRAKKSESNGHERESRLGVLSHSDSSEAAAGGPHLCLGVGAQGHQSHSKTSAQASVVTAMALVLTDGPHPAGRCVT